MKTGVSLMLLAEDNPADADLILASLTKDGFAGAIQVVRDGVDARFCVLSSTDSAWRAGSRRGPSSPPRWS